MKKDQIKEMFKSNTEVTVTFTKKNGDERTMVCTQSLGMIPEKYCWKSGPKESKQWTEIMK